MDSIREIFMWWKRLIYSLKLQMSQFTEKSKLLMKGLGEIFGAVFWAYIVHLISNRLAG